MTIVTENLVAYTRTFDKVRVAKIAYYGSVYLDFQNEFLYFQNESMIVRIPLELEDKQDIENVFVFDGDKFFLLVNQYETLSFDGKSFISPDNNEFKLSLFSEPYDLPELDPNPEDESWEEINFTVTPDLLYHIRNAMTYISLEQDSLKGIFFDGGELIALQSKKFYQASIDILENFSLPYDFLKVFLSFENLGNLTIYKQNHGDAHRYIFKQNEVTIRFVTSENLSIPVDIHSEDFIKNYDHENYFCLSKSSFVEASNFLEPFTKDIVKSKVIFRFDPNSDSLTIHVNDEQNFINYKVEVEEYSSNTEFQDKELSISLSSVSSIFSQINSELVYITFDSDSPAMKFSSGSDANYFIILTKIKTD